MNNNEIDYNHYNRVKIVNREVGSNRQRYN